MLVFDVGLRLREQSRLIKKQRLVLAVGSLEFSTLVRSIYPNLQQKSQNMLQYATVILFTRGDV